MKIMVSEWRGSTWEGLACIVFVTPVFGDRAEPGLASLLELLEPA